MEQLAGVLPTSEHFELRQLTDGVYAAIGIASSAAFSNAGIVDLGDQTLIFDAFETPQAAQDLKVVAEQLTGHPVSYVVISHTHYDHWGGTRVFGPQVPIITAQAIREEMPDSIDWLEQLQEDPSELEEGINYERKQLETETDEHRRAALEFSIARMSHMLAALPTLEFRFPNLGFAQKLVFYGSQRMAELVAVAPGHTVCDVYLVLPVEGIMFMGDLGFFQSQPFLVFSDPQAWQAWLEETEQSDVEIFIPGHGLPGTKADLALQRQYIALVEDLVARVIREGGSVQDVLERSLPAPFDAWQRDSPARWEANVQTLYERLSGEGGEAHE